MTLNLTIHFNSETELIETPIIDNITLLFAQGRSLTVYPEETDASLEENVAHYRLKGLYYFNPEETYLEKIFSENTEFSIINVEFEEDGNISDYSYDDLTYSYWFNGKIFPEEETEESHSGEIELNRAYIYDNEGEPIGETNFTVSILFLKKLYKNEYKDIFPDFEEFLQCYDPEIEGEHIYQEAKRKNELVEDSGVFMYGDIEEEY